VCDVCGGYICCDVLCVYVHMCVMYVGDIYVVMFCVCVRYMCVYVCICVSVSVCLSVYKWAPTKAK